MSQALVSWSGGKDSTLVLHNLLQLRTVQVRTISITHSQVGAETEQRKAREKIKKKLVKSFGEFESFEVRVESEANAAANDGVSQPIIWIPLATTYLYANEDFYVGYVAGDSVWHYKTQIHDLFSNCQALLGKYGKLVAPLEWENKFYIITELYRNKLLKDAWCCESPLNGKACGVCNPCETHELYMDYLKKKGRLE